MRRLNAIGLFILLTFSGSHTLYGAVTDALTISVTPNAYYAVSIDTDNVSLDLGNVELGSSTQTVSPSTITIESTFAYTDLKIQGSIASSGTPWTFDDNAASTEPNKIAVWAVFTDVNRSSAPTQSDDYFSGSIPGANGSDMVDGTNRYVGSSAGDGTVNICENNSGFDAKDMDGMLPDPDPNGSSHLWLYFRLPNASTDPNQQDITFRITAVAPD